MRWRALVGSTYALAVPSRDSRQAPVVVGRLIAALTEQAALDVAIERLTRFHPGAQIFLFDAQGRTVWTAFDPTPDELELLRLGLNLLEQHQQDPAPLVLRGASGHFTALVLDAERTLGAVVLLRPRRRPPAEARVKRSAPPRATWRQ